MIDNKVWNELTTELKAREARLKVRHAVRLRGDLPDIAVALEALAAFADYQARRSGVRLINDDTAELTFASFDFGNKHAIALSMNCVPADTVAATIYIVDKYEKAARLAMQEREAMRLLLLRAGRARRLKTVKKLALVAKETK